MPWNEAPAPSRKQPETATPHALLATAPPPRLYFEDFRFVEP